MKITNSKGSYHGMLYVKYLTLPYIKTCRFSFEGPLESCLHSKEVRLNFKWPPGESFFLIRNLLLKPLFLDSSSYTEDSQSTSFRISAMKGLAD